MNLALLRFRLVLWNKVDRLLSLNSRENARVIETGCPFEEWLGRTDYQCSAVQHAQRCSVA
jgi:hypothetical protein